MGGPGSGPRPRRLKGLEDMIEASGFDPTEFEFQRLVEAQKKVAEWKDYIRVGKVPPDLIGCDTKEAEDVVRELEVEVLKESKTWREYRFGKKRSVEGALADGAEASLLEILKASRDQE